MKYWIEFPAGTEGGYGGRHWFATKKERQAFFRRMTERGIYPALVKVGP